MVLLAVNQFGKFRVLLASRDQENSGAENRTHKQSLETD
jgi:hypothetical protein